jgi:hypothetical protein
MSLDLDDRDAQLIYWAKLVRLLDKIDRVVEVSADATVLIALGERSCVANLSSIGLTPRTAAAYLRAGYRCDILDYSERLRRHLVDQYGCMPEDFNDAAAQLEMAEAPERAFSERGKRDRAPEGVLREAQEISRRT